MLSRSEGPKHALLWGGVGSRRCPLIIGSGDKSVTIIIMSKLTTEQVGSLTLEARCNSGNAHRSGMETQVVGRPQIHVRFRHLL